MMEPKDDYDGLRQRLEAIGYDGRYKDNEQVINALVAVHLTLESFQLSDAAKNAVLNFISKKGRESLEQVPDWDENSWQDFDYGNVKIGDFVRVKPGSYDSEFGARHNGMVGILSSMNRNIGIVNYIGLGTGNSMKHSMERLQSLRRSVQ